jgi:hypothetical protein
LPAPNHTYELIDQAELARLAWIARSDREDFFARNPRYSALADRLICVALCQGAALHLIDGTNGVKDFDVWTFFAAHPGDPLFPWRRRSTRVFGDPEFGRPPDKPDFVGRRVDLLGRSPQSGDETTPDAILSGYLSEGATETARALSKKAVVLLEPTDRLGDIVWPLAVSSPGPQLALTGRTRPTR